MKPYTKEYIKNLLVDLKGILDDIDMYSVHNDDKFNEEVAAIRIIRARMSKQIEK